MPTGAQLRLPLVRLPAVLFPRQSVTLSTQPGSPISHALTSLAWRAYDGQVAAVGPIGRVGVQLRFLYDTHVLGAEHPTPEGVAHAVAGERVRLVKVCNNEPHLETSEAAASISAFDPLADVAIASEARAEKVGDEAMRALQLMEQGLKSRSFALEPSHLDEELGMHPPCDARCHPLWNVDAEPPSEPSDLSFWLAARLPLSSSLRASILANTCPLKRIQDINDSMRLLISSDSARFRHRLRLSVDAPATDGCSTLGTQPPPRRIVAEAAPMYSWVAEDSFPHG